MGEVASCEKEFERVKERRGKVREAMEQVRRRLPIVVDVNLSSSPEDFKEAEILCNKLKSKDRETLLGLMRERDEAKKAWLSNFLNGEL
jgi:hypothetical protein